MSRFGEANRSCTHGKVKQMQNEAAIREEQNKDFFNVGRLLLALCNGNLGAASVNRMRESLANVSHLYSADLHNALMCVDCLFALST